MSIERNTLIVRGEKRSESEEQTRGRYRRECYYGSFDRRIPLPAEVDPDQARAKFRKGVLTVTLPKTAEARRRVRRIPVHRR